MLSGLHATGEHPITGLAEMFSVSRPTVYRVLGNRTGTAARTTAAGSPTARESAA
jgi:Helix-turn-helix domain of resolvase